MRKIICFFMLAVLLISFSGCKSTAPAEQTTTATTPVTEKYFCTYDNDKVKILSIEGYDGLFVEKGGFDQVKGVAAVKVRNDSKEMIDFAKLTFKVNEYERAQFEIKALPAGETVIAMEITAKPFNATDKYVLVQDGASTFAAYGTADMQSSKVQLTTEGGNITVKNLTDKELKSVAVYYKYYIDGNYYGGIAFRGSFENIKPGEAKTQTSDRFAKNGKIVDIDIE